MNELKELRMKLNLTQVEAANLLNVSRRSYQMYETQEIDNAKYQYLLEKMKQSSLLDEEHGVLTFEFIKHIVNQVLNDYDVTTCYLFGSYSRGTAHEKSDVDLLIDSPITGLNYYGLVEELREKLNKKVDLLTTKELLQNEQLICEILKDGIKIYGRN